MELELIQNIIHMAGNSGNAIKNAANGFDAIKSLITSADAENDSNSKLKIEIGEMANRLAHAQIENLNLTSQLNALYDEVVQVNDFKQKLDRYELWKTDLGATVYRLKEEHQTDQPLHFLCTSCVGTSQKTLILQGDIYCKKCSNCGTSFEFKESPKIGWNAPPTY